MSKQFVMVFFQYFLQLKKVELSYGLECILIRAFEGCYSLKRLISLPLSN